MKSFPRMLIALSLSTAAILSAQTPSTSGDDSAGARRGGRGGPGGHGGHGRGGHPIVRALDADKDRELSSAELAGAPAALRALDANQDGSVSIDELRPVRPAGMPERTGESKKRSGDASTPKSRPASERDGNAHARPADPVMLALDANSDRSLSEAEINNATASLTALDLNKDGKLTADELRPLPPSN